MDFPILLQGAMFASTRWTNFYFSNDPVGGQRTPVFLKGIEEQPLEPGKLWWRPITACQLLAEDPHRKTVYRPAATYFDRAGECAGRGRWRAVSACQRAAAMGLVSVPTSQLLAQQGRRESSGALKTI